MKKTFIGMFAFIGVIFVAVLFMGTHAPTRAQNEKPAQVLPPPLPSPQSTPSNPKNATYQVNGMLITLKDGISELPVVDGAASKIVTRYFGNEASGDLDGDGTIDTIFLVTQQSGGSGTFFYVVAALNTLSGYKGTNAILLGDRIAPQSTEFRDGTIIVNYAERKSSEPMTARQSVGVSKYLKVLAATLVEEKLVPTPPTVQKPKPIPAPEPLIELTDPNADAGKNCVDQGGNWSDTYHECTGIGESACAAIGGDWNGCASACRHNPKAQMCTMQCVLVCTVPGGTSSEGVKRYIP